MTTVASARNSRIYSVLRPRKSRTRSGCLACRKRRKKCDELAPVCESCDRLDLKCSWPVGSLDGCSVVGSSPVPRPQLTPQARLSTTTESRDTTRTVSFSFEDGDEFNILGSPKEAFLAELRDLGQHFHDRGILPYSKSIAPGVHDQILSSEGSETAILFDHFCHKTAPWLVNGDCYDNPVLRHIVPLTVTDDLVLHTMLAISGTHLQYSMPSIAALATNYYSYALRNLKHRLSDWLSSSNKGYKPLFAAMILLCHCEVSIQRAVGSQL